MAVARLAGQFLWLSMTFTMLCRIGSEIGVSQNMGRGDTKDAMQFAQNGFMLALLTSKKQQYFQAGDRNQGNPAGYCARA